MTDQKEKFKKEFIARLVQFSIAVMQFAKDTRADRNMWALADQLVRSAGSIGANVVEAKGSSSKKDYARFFTIALKSANETKYWLLVAREYDKTYEKKAGALLNEAEEIANILGASVLTLSGKR